MILDLGVSTPDLFTVTKPVYPHIQNLRHFGRPTSAPELHNLVKNDTMCFAVAGSHRHLPAIWRRRKFYPPGSAKMSGPKIRWLIVWLVQSPVVNSTRPKVTLYRQGFMQSIFGNGFDHGRNPTNVIS
jgi:hypothetical protein